MKFNFQIALIAILIGCVAFISCERARDAVDGVIMDDGMPAEDMPADDMPADDMPADDMPADDATILVYIF